MPATKEPTLSVLAQDALSLYETQLKTALEPRHSGQAVAVHVDSADYEVAPTHREAVRALLARHAPDGRIVTLTIGPPTDGDLRLAARMVTSPKR